MEEKKSLEVVSGDGSELNISSVHDHISVAKPRSATEKPMNIVIPKETTKTSKDKKEKDETEEEEEN